MKFFVCNVCEDPNKFLLCDELAVALALDEKVSTSAEVAACSVETMGSLTRGQMVSRQPSTETNDAEVRLVTGLDSERVVHFLVAAVTD